MVSSGRAWQLASFLVTRWCDWADAVLASAAPDTRAVLVHGDLHGDNQVWDRNELRLVVDFETVGAAARIPLADHRTPPDWIDDLAARFHALGMGRFG